MLRILSFSLLALAFANTDFETCIAGAKPFVKSFKSCLANSESDDGFRNCICTKANKAELSICAKAIPTVPVLADYFGEMDISKTDESVELFCSAPIDEIKKELNVVDLRKSLKNSLTEMCTLTDFMELENFLKESNIPEPNAIIEMYKELCSSDKPTVGAMKHDEKRRKENNATATTTMSSLTSTLMTTATGTKAASSTSGAIATAVAGLGSGIALLVAIL